MTEPTDEAWASRDRTVVCFVTRLTTARRTAACAAVRAMTPLVLLTMDACSSRVDADRPEPAV
jgi:hypothetical protein